MSTTVNQGGLYTIPPGGTEMIAFPFSLGSASVVTKTATKTLLRGIATDSPLTLGTLSESAGTVTVPVSSVTEGQLWQVTVTVVTNETPAQTLSSTAQVLCETPRG